MAISRAMRSHISLLLWTLLLLVAQPAQAKYRIQDDWQVSPSPSKQFILVQGHDANDSTVSFGEEKLTARILLDKD